MADNIVDSLNIEISADVENAMKAFSKLASSLKQIQKITTKGNGLDDMARAITNFAGSVNKAIFKIERLANALEKLKQNYSAMSSVARDAGKATAIIGNNLPKSTTQQTASADLGETSVGTKDVEKQQLKAQSAMKGFAKRLEEVGKSSKKSSKPLGAVASAFKRIVLYRVIRAVISAISKAFREGASNVYQYSKAIGSLDSNNAQKNLDAMSASITRIKNTLGVTAMSVLDALRPLFDRLATSIINAANALNQFLASLEGKSTYTVATSIVTAYTEETEKANEATSKMLARFDELNNISLSKSSETSTSSTPNYGDMFVEKAVDQATVDRFKDILETVEKIGLVIAAWKITNSLVDWARVFNLKDVEGHLTPVGEKIARVLAGAALVTISFIVTKNSFAEILSGNGSIGSWLAAALSTAAAGFGLFKLFGTTGLILEGITLALSFVWGAFEAKEIIFENTPLSKRLNEIKSRAEETIKTNTEVLMNVEARLEQVSYAGSSYDSVQAMVDRLFEINNKTVLSSLDLSTIAAYVETINGLNIDGLHLDLDPDGRVHQTYLEVTDIIEGLKQEARMKGVQSAMSGAYEDMAKQALNGKSVQKDYDDAYKIYAEISKKYARQKAYYDKQIAAISNSDMDENAKNTSLSQLYATSGWREYQDTQKYYSKAKDTYETAKEALDGYNDAMAAIQDEINTYENMLVSFSNNVGDAFEKVGDKADGAGKNIKKVVDSIKDLPSKKKVDIDLNINGTVKSASGGGGQKMINVNVDHFMASGGFPSAGEVFIAREAGPEMVGTIGGHTAVANNQQIVEAISQGVFRAMTSAGGSQNVSVVLEGDAKKLFRAVQKESYSYTRSTGRPAFT